VAGSSVKIAFDGPVNQARIERSFRVHPALEGRLEWLDGGTLSFRPATALAYETVYTVEVATSGREDLAWQWTFVTVKPITVTIDDCASTAGELRSVLAVLARKRIKAIMFPTGICNATFPWLVPQMLAEGHTVCNHTYSHPRLTKLSDAQIASEIRSGVTAGGCKLLRPPWGDWDGPGGRVERIAAQLGYQIMLWDVDTFDWAGASAADMLAAIRARGGVILVHFHGKHTVSTLEQL
jgi:peptidoglycan/xylan/chitin deacetylase (PgdA/CDA1 family)